MFDETEGLPVPSGVAAVDPPGDTGARSNSSLFNLGRMSRKSFRSCSPGIRSKENELPLIHCFNFVSFRSAARRCPLRTELAPHSTEATTQASRIKSRMLVDSAGARPLPVLKRFNAASNSRRIDGKSASYCLNSNGMSEFGASKNLNSQCSISTSKWVRDRHSPAADSSAFRQVTFNFSNSKRGFVTAIAGVLLGGRGSGVCLFCDESEQHCHEKNQRLAGFL